MTSISPAQVESNWNSLLELVLLNMPEETRPHWLYLLKSLRDDVVDGDNRTLLGFKRAPAAKGNHHAYEGGLVAHLLEMWSIHETLRGAFPHLMQAPHITNARVLTAILSHDLHKAYRTYQVIPQSSTWAVEYSKDPSELYHTWTTKSLSILMRFGIVLDDEQFNAFLWSEGGWSDIKPKASTVLAKYCYILDEFSGNILARLEGDSILDCFKRIPSSHEIPATVTEPVYTGSHCSLCQEPQYDTPSGLTCKNGHGGVPSLKEPTPTKIGEVTFGCVPSPDDQALMAALEQSDRAP